jgi:Asp-tRNA(Asn)/Glu-tRNA(Gln) amidotransferase A subunit family amidase
MPPTIMPRAMKSVSRFPDWCSLSEHDRVAALEQSQKRLAGIGRKLNAVEQILPADVSSRGPLAGMPYVAKDMIATGKIEPSWGCSGPMAAALPRASIINRMEQAGACLVGTAKMTELAYEPSGFIRGGALNPWGPDAVPGGSSTGSAILVASGCCFAALGSDTGGSVRIPAHCCGVTGLKPSYGSLPLDGTMPLAPSLDTIGIITRSVADLALIWPSVSGESAGPVAERPSGAVLADTFGACDPEIAEICRGAIGVLTESGVAVAARSGFPEQADQNALLVLQAEAARQHRERMEDTRIDATLRKRLRKGLAISDEALGLALEARDELRRQFLSEYLDDATVALLPVMPIRTPRVEEVDAASAHFNPRALYALSRFTRFVNYLGLPALAVPAGFDSRGLPVGLQIVGRPGSDASLLEIGARLQARTDWHGRVPPGIWPEIAGEKGFAA